MDAIIAQWPRFLNATWLTIWMFLLVTVLSTVIGLALAIAAQVGGRAVSIPISLYTAVFRGLPELIVLLACYLALPALGLDLGAIGSALLGFTLIGVAFEVEIFRAGLAAVDPRLLEASRSLGMSWRLTLRRIVLPQVVRIVIPAWATFSAGYVKAFALASAVAVTDIMAVTRQALAVSTQPFALIVFAGLIYGAIASVLMVFELVATRYVVRRYGTLRQSQE
jgi:His/Glu/Gln/Arg/opine family amino acid ABC transporter permease subunit